jgi:hypothetical protein
VILIIYLPECSIFWDERPCSVVYYQISKECNVSETFVSFYQTTLHHISFVDYVTTHSVCEVYSVEWKDD